MPQLVKGEMAREPGEYVCRRPSSAVPQMMLREDRFWKELRRNGGQIHGYVSKSCPTNSTSVRTTGEVVDMVRL